MPIKNIGVVAATLGLIAAVPAMAQTYTLAQTLGQAGISGFGMDNTHFLGAISTAVDPGRCHLFIADSGNQRIQIYDTATLAYVGTIGSPPSTGGDNQHLAGPEGVEFDAANDHILVADTENGRVQIFDAQTFAYVATIGGFMNNPDNNHFSTPVSVKVNPRGGQIYVADIDDHRVQIFDSRSFAYIGTLGVSGVAGQDALHLNFPDDAEYNPASNQIMVADSGNKRVMFYDATTFQPVSQLGVTGASGDDNDHFSEPVSVVFDPLNNLILVSDATNGRIQLFTAGAHKYFGTVQNPPNGTGANFLFGRIFNLSIDPVHRLMIVGDFDNNRVVIFNDTASPLVSSVLPGTRSVQLGTAPTVFANIVNAGSTALAGCQIGLAAAAPAGLTLDYQITDPRTNALSGAIDTPAAIPAAPAGGVSSQTFVLTFNSPTAFAQLNQPLEFTCDGIGPAPVTFGVNTVDLLFSASPVPDVIALSATGLNDGIVHVPLGNAGAFAVATDNIGSAATLAATADTGGATLPLTATICQTGVGGICLAPPAASVPVTFATGAEPTFSIFVSASEPIALAAGASRIFVRFLDSSGVSHGATSVAVQTD